MKKITHPPKCILLASIAFSLLISGCATSDDVAKMIEANNASIIQEKLDSSKETILKTITPQLEEITQKTEMFSLTIENLQKELARIESQSTNARNQLEKTLNIQIEEIVQRQDIEARQTEDNLSKLRKVIAIQSKGLEESTRAFREKLSSEEQKIKETLRTLENFLRSSLSDWEISANEIRRQMSDLKLNNTSLANRIEDVAQELEKQSSVLKKALQDQLKSLQNAIDSLDEKSLTGSPPIVNDSAPHEKALTENQRESEKATAEKESSPIATENTTLTTK